MTQQLPQLGKKISQEYFDSIVNENVNEFEMSLQEAIEDACNQLKSQGADLTTICKYGQQEQNELVENLKKLKDLIPKLIEINRIESTSIHFNESDIETTISILQLIKEKFNKDISFRCLATRITPPENNAYNIFMSFFSYLKPFAKCLDESQEKTYSLLVENFLSTFQSYLNQQTDVMESKGLRTFIHLTDCDASNDNELSGFGFNVSILQCLLKCINTSCIMCESNRQFFVENGLCENLMKIFHKHKANNSVLCDACQLIRSLLLDDDIRVEFGHSHEHAKYIASQLNGIDVLLDIGLKNEIILGEDTLGNIMLTLSKLAVRNEFCQEICDKGGLKFVLQCIEEKHLQNISLLKSALSLLKSICNNDQVKHEATKSNAIGLLKRVLEKYTQNTQICELTCSALSTLLLRNTESSEQLYAFEAHKTLVQLLNIHSNKPKIVKSVCLALRNSISRSKHLGEKLIELNIENTLRSIMNQNDSSQYYDEVKSVLRDLGCHIELKELWTGTGKNLQT